MTSQPIPIVCDMTDAPDTTEERLAEYRRLFGNDLIGRERTENGIRFRFSLRDGLAAEIRDLAAREKACCAFFDFTLHLTPSALHLEVRAPESAAKVLADLFGATA